MHEFDTVSVSSFEAASLAAKLTEKSADGWDVIAIVPAGSDVTAYLRRESTTGRSDEAPETGGAATPVAAFTAAAAAADRGSDEPVEPAGWGSAPEASAASSSWGSSSTTPAESSTSWGSGSERAADTAGSGSGSAPAAETTAVWGTGASSTQAASASPSVPPGWYADPSGRYELRYWDGAAWTEHVARQGQQYTDPPVA